MALAGKIGAELDIQSDIPPHGYCFAEDQARYVITATSQNVEIITELANKANVPLQIAGTTGHNGLKIKDVLSISLEDVRNAHSNWLPDLMAAPK